MRKLLLALLLAALPAVTAAQVKISALPGATTPLAGTEVTACVQSGVTDKCTAQAIASVAPLLQTVATATSITPVAGNVLVIQNNTQGAGTLTVNAPTGTPSDGQMMILRLKSTNVQTFAWNAIYNAPSANLSLPTASSGSSLTDYIAFRYNSTSATWDLLAVSFGAASPLTVVQGGTGVGTLTGIVKGNGTSTFTVAAQADGVALFQPAADVNSLGIGTSALTQGGITGTDNTAVGQGTVLGAITSGSDNTAVGYQAGAALTTGAQNAAFGSQALVSQTTAGATTALGYKALNANTSGTHNTAVGAAALQNNTTATDNTAVGYLASLGSATGSSGNTAVGSTALEANVTGNSNTAVGAGAGTVLTGSNNTLVGNAAGGSLTSGAGNFEIGSGADAITTGNNNVIFGGGSIASPTANNQIDIVAGTIFTSNWSTGPIQLKGGMVSKGTTFTITSGCATVSALTGGATAGSFATTTTGTCTPVIALPTAPNGWSCHADDLTHAVVFTQTAKTANSCTVSGTTTSGDTIVFMAIGY